ncbi:uncharacterized protein Z518_11201 [Rhinocladiella mackenziei CBS 650.93]|uniref:Xylanolytic transcriptional activator regulatory domain-containing protein n=1 Tax=Rhinocladiella mackenziei CBS 650.93 TaxID=1442369 RepID=A0A0D2GM57_9EURO|nr:uncharacterized protein Z518_11201 [Rhinocladiella mackenziei CBS 650.93]KIW99462.1 hypothetical protein Z518_11201 [Rhinocladiella mackenziei CBS 650.93]
MTDPVRVTPNGRKRPRAARACEACRAHKQRCDEFYPCSKCKSEDPDHPNLDDYAHTYEERNITCVYVNSFRFRESSVSSRRSSSNPGARKNEISTHDGREASSTEDNPFGQTSGSAVSNGKEQELCSQPLEASKNVEGELREVNQHTLDTEFHGPSSSMAFLAAIQQQSTMSSEDRVQADVSTPSIISTLHNSSFSAESESRYDPEGSALSAERYFFRQSQSFLAAYFQTLHFIHPIIDKEEFLLRCEDLWFGNAEKQSTSFVALYFAVMSLGALMGEWEEPKFLGKCRFEWSRKMFRCANLAMILSQRKNDLETVQGNLILAKVCQNELNPHLAYTYLGTAIRISLSAGYNRQPTPTPSEPSGQVLAQRNAASRTWWGLYSLEVELSFALGRPDCLGLDVYHNREMPGINDSETAIIAVMVELARIIKKASISVYLSNVTIHERLRYAHLIENELEAWVQKLPSMLRPQASDGNKGVGIMRTRKWEQRQRDTLEFRYFNVKMVLFRPFLLHKARDPQSQPVELDTAVSKCAIAARETIRKMYQMFCSHSYFRSWWYNTTYTLYAASIILCYATKIAPIIERPELFNLIGMSVEILEAMKDAEVARKAAELLNRVLSRVREGELDSDVVIDNSNSQPCPASLDDPAVDIPQSPITKLFFDLFYEQGSNFGQDSFSLYDVPPSEWLV